MYTLKQFWQEIKESTPLERTAMIAVVIAASIFAWPFVAFFLKIK
jgi:hypothetical protein